MSYEMCHQAVMNTKWTETWTGFQRDKRIEQLEMKQRQERCAPSSELSDGFPSCQVFVFNLKHYTHKWNPTKSFFVLKPLWLSLIHTSSNRNRSSFYLKGNTTLMAYSNVIFPWKVQSKCVNMIYSMPNQKTVYKVILVKVKPHIGLWTTVLKTDFGHCNFRCCPFFCIRSDRMWSLVQPFAEEVIITTIMNLKPYCDRV